MEPPVNVDEGSIQTTASFDGWKSVVSSLSLSRDSSLMVEIVFTSLSNTNNPKVSMNDDCSRKWDRRSENESLDNFYTFHTDTYE